MSGDPEPITEWADEDIVFVAAPPVTITLGEYYARQEATAEADAAAVEAEAEAHAAAQRAAADRFRVIFTAPDGRMGSRRLTDTEVGLLELDPVSRAWCLPGHPLAEEDVAALNETLVPEAPLPSRRAPQFWRPLARLVLQRWYQRLR